MKVATFLHKARRGRKKVTKRKGKPLTVYFNEALAHRLHFVSQERRVPKATLVRFAVERLLNQLSTGQLELPLGL
jgi:hypothetical protein